MCKEATMGILRVIVTAVGAVTAAAVLGRRQMERDGKVVVVLPKELYKELSKEGGPLDLPGIAVFPVSAKMRQSVVERSAENEISSATAPCGQPNVIIDSSLTSVVPQANRSSPEVQRVSQATPSEEEQQQAVAAHLANEDASQPAQ